VMNDVKQLGSCLEKVYAFFYMTQKVHNYL
jgi:hypothetical protein